MKHLLLFSLFIAIFCFVGCSQKQPGICELHFVVIDAKTRKGVPNYEFKFPTTNGNTIAGCTLYRREDRGIFYAPSSYPVDVTISAPGYSKQIIPIQPRFETTAGSLPEPKEISLLQ